MLLSANSWAKDDAYLLTYNSESGEYYISVELTAGDIFKPYGSNGDIWLGYSKFGTGTGSAIAAGLITSDSNDNVVVSTSGTYEIYVNPSAKTVWMQLSAASTAQAWANNFLGTTYDICSVGSSSDDHSEALAAQWPTLKTAFEDLTIGAKGYINNVANGTQEDATVLSAVNRYTHIVTRYTNLDLFDGLNVSRSRALSPIAIPNANTVLMFVTISAIVVISAVGLFFIIRKRKHQ